MIYEYYFSRLDQAGKLVYRKLLEEIMKNTGSFLFRYGADAANVIDRVYNAIDYDHPELFYVDFTSINYRFNDRETILEVNYTCSGEELYEKQNKIRQILNKLLQKAAVEKTGTDLRKCQWIHDRLVRNIIYNEEAIVYAAGWPDSYTIEGVFLSKRAVCEGIAKAFKVLGDLLSLPVIVVIGDAAVLDDTSGGMTGHAWNIAKVNGQYVQIDATWDGNLSLAVRHYRYDYFCISDKWMRKDHLYGNYPVCPTDDHSYFVKTGRVFQDKSGIKEFVRSKVRKGENPLF